MERYIVKDIIKKDVNNLNNRSYYVYVHILPKNISNYNNDKYYVGITSQDKPNWRWKHDGSGYKFKNINGDGYFWRAIQKYGWENFEHHIIASNINEYEAKNIEIKLINILQSNNKKYGYNSTSGGDHVNIQLSNETRQRMSEIAKERWKDPIYREQHSGINSPNYGQGEKISQYLPKGENTNKARKVICLNTQEVFGCIRYATRKYGIPETHISRNCRHKSLSAGKDENGNKLVWIYYEEYINLSSEEIENILNRKDKIYTKKIINLETEKVYNSIKEAIEKTGDKRSLIQSHIHHHVNNPRWLYYDEYINTNNNI